LCCGPKDGTKKTIDLYNDATCRLIGNRFGPAETIRGATGRHGLNPASLIATSNFTDKNGSAALGLNLRAAYLPFRRQVTLTKTPVLFPSRPLSV
jgi:hypothetical protein